MKTLICCVVTAAIGYLVGVVVSCKGIAVADEEQREELESLCARIDRSLKKLSGDDA